MKKDVPDAPPEDIPAWFMTYSDVITLLMTFFILLLTFSTTEPEKFNQERIKFIGKSAATGVAGAIHEGLEKNSWSKRVRPRAARMAMTGSEMPTSTLIPEERAKGRGLKSVTEEESKRDVMRSYTFEMQLAEVISAKLNLTSKGLVIARKLATQLRALPVHCALEISDRSKSELVTAYAHHLFHMEKARPGQVSVGFVDDLDSGAVRFVIERYQQ